MNGYAREYGKRKLEEARQRRWETAIICSYHVNCSGATKTPKSAKSIYEKMKIVDPEKAEEVSGPRRVYKGSMKSQFEQHIKYLEGKDGDHK